VGNAGSGAESLEASRRVRWGNPASGVRRQQAGGFQIGEDHGHLLQADVVGWTNINDRAEILDDGDAQMMQAGVGWKALDPQ